MPAGKSESDQEKIFSIELPTIQGKGVTKSDKKGASISSQPLWPDFLFPPNAKNANDRKHSRAKQGLAPRSIQRKNSEQEYEQEHNDPGNDVGMAFYENEHGILLFANNDRPVSLRRGSGIVHMLK
jgi:hypothetical protein